MLTSVISSIWPSAKKFASQSYCTVCNTDSPNVADCTSCHSSAYCSTRCQEFDWPIHKLLCKTPRLHSFPPKLKHPSTLSIYFPVSRKTPELVWVYPEVQKDFSGKEVLVPNIMGLLNEDKARGGGMKCLVFARNFREEEGFDLDHELVMVVRNNFISDGSKENASIVSMTKDVVHYNFRGPAVLFRQRMSAKTKMRKEGIQGLDAQGREAVMNMISMVDWDWLELDMGRVEDVRLEDLRHVVDWLNTYPENRSSPVVPYGSHRLELVNSHHIYSAEDEIRAMRIMVAEVDPSPSPEDIKAMQYANYIGLGLR